MAIAEARASPTAPKWGFSGRDLRLSLNGPQSLMIPPDSFSKAAFEIKSLSKGNISSNPMANETITLSAEAKAGVLVSPLAYKTL